MLNYTATCMQVHYQDSCKTIGTRDYVGSNYMPQGETMKEERDPSDVITYQYICAYYWEKNSN